MLNKLVKKISEQQNGLDISSPAYCIGEQLKAICTSSPKCAEIVLQDLNQEEGSIVKLAEEFKKYADKNHKNKSVYCITPQAAEGLIRNFYSLPQTEAVDIDETPIPSRTCKFVNLEDFI